MTLGLWVALLHTHRMGKQGKLAMPCALLPAGWRLWPLKGKTCPFPWPIIQAPLDLQLPTPP